MGHVIDVGLTAEIHTASGSITSEQPRHGREEFVADAAVQIEFFLGIVVRQFSFCGESRKVLLHVLIAGAQM